MYNMLAYGCHHHLKVMVKQSHNIILPASAHCMMENWRQIFNIPFIVHSVKEDHFVF